jgi:hypothetical protein
MLIDGQENETIDQAVPSHSNCEGRKIADSVKPNQLPCPKIEANKARGKAVQRWQSCTGIGGLNVKTPKTVMNGTLPHIIVLFIVSVHVL